MNFQPLRADGLVKKAVYVTGMAAVGLTWLVAVSCGESVEVASNPSRNFSGAWTFRVSSEVYCTDFPTCADSVTLGCLLVPIPEQPAPDCLAGCYIENNSQTVFRKNCLTVIFEQTGNTLTAVCGDAPGTCIYGASGALTFDGARGYFTGTLTIGLGSSDCATCTDTYVITEGKVYDVSGGVEFWSQYTRTSVGSDVNCGDFTHTCQPTTGSAEGYFAGTIAPLTP